VAQPARIAVDDGLEKRAAFLDREDLVDLFLVLGEGKPHLGMVEDVGQLLGDRILVDRDRHPAQSLRRGNRPIEPRPVVADDRQLVAAPETQGLQPGGEGFDFGRDLGPAPALPDAVILLAHRRTVGALAGMLQQQLRKRVERMAL
jgi:hypothetical protein